MDDLPINQTNIDDNNVQTPQQAAGVPLQPPTATPAPVTQPPAQIPATAPVSTPQPPTATPTPTAIPAPQPPTATPTPTAIPAPQPPTPAPTPTAIPDAQPTTPATPQQPLIPKSAPTTKQTPIIPGSEGRPLYETPKAPTQPESTYELPATPEILPSPDSNLEIKSKDELPSLNEQIEKQKRASPAQTPTTAKPPEPEVKIVDKTKNLTKTHSIEKPADSLTKEADEEEEKFIQEVEKHHGLL